jgi:hypothetical protein
MVKGGRREGVPEAQGGSYRDGLGPIAAIARISESRRHDRTILCKVQMLLSPLACCGLDALAQLLLFGGKCNWGEKRGPPS